MKQKGYSENVSVPEGYNANGVHTTLHFEGDTLTVQRTYDAEPHLNHARYVREQQEGQRWGEGKFVGHIPPAVYGKLLLIPDKQERQRALRQWLRDNQAFVTYQPWLKGSK